MKIDIRKMKTGLYFLAGLIAVLVLASAVYFLLLFPLLEGKLKVYASMVWMYLCVYGYYWWTKRYTNWWTILKEEKIK